MRRRQRTSLLVGIVMTLAAGSPLARGYAIIWYSIDGGGTMQCTGGTEGTSFELSGTIGQPEASLTMSGGGQGEGSLLDLTGGFWFASAGGEPGCLCGDIDESGGPVDLADFAAFAICYGLDAPLPPDCDADAFACSDLDGDGAVDLADFATFANWYGLTATQTVPDCGQE